VYREGMADAIADGQSKAAFLAAKVGGTLGAAQSVVEEGGYIGCTSPDESEFTEYEGEQPDFGSGEVVARAVPPEAAATPVHVGHARKPKHGKRKHAGARGAAAVSCTLKTRVSLAYVLQ
jgi:hypothetical protein